ncbi:MAG: hypothetical protein ACLFV6_03225 [Spirulinaceae cyanobacterium]
MAASEPERLGTQFLVEANELIQREFDEQRRGHLMNDIYRISSQLGIAASNLRNLKAMTTPQLEAYADQLYEQIKDNNSVKRLSAA